MKIALFGGTFNPIHNAHLFIANEILNAYALDKVVFIPDNKPPHKTMEYNLPARLRLEMVNLAIKDNKNFLSSNIEIKRGGVSYTFDTVMHIKEKYAIKQTLYFIIGADLLPELDKWYKIDELKNEVNFIVFNRNGINIQHYLKNYPAISSFKSLRLDISSTDIRDRIKNKKQIKYLVPSSVEKYIKKNKLYVD